MLSPTAASVSFSSRGGSLWLNSTWGAVWLARRPSLNSYMRIIDISLLILYLYSVISYCSHYSFKVQVHAIFKGLTCFLHFSRLSELFQPILVIQFVLSHGCLVQFKPFKFNINPFKAMFLLFYLWTKQERRVSELKRAVKQKHSGGRWLCIAHSINKNIHIHIHTCITKK